MRGSNSDQVLVLVDGMRLGRGSMGGADLSTIPLNQVERIEIIRGARATIYGADAIAGVINIITRSDVSDKKTKLNMGIGSKGYATADAMTKFAATDSDYLKLGAAYSRENGYNVKPSASNTGDEHGYWSKNAQINHEHAFSDVWSLFSSIRFMQKQSAFDSSGTYKDQFTQDQNYQMALERHDVNWQSTWSAQYAVTDYYSGFDKNADYHDATYKTYNDQTSLGWYNQYDLADGWILGGGVDWRESRLKDGSESYSSRTRRWTEMDGLLHNTGSYALVQYEKNAWTWELSGRVDENSDYGTHNTYRTGVAWEFEPNYRVLANYSTSFRAPTLLNLYYPGSGNPNLKAETAHGGEIGLEGANDYFTWKLTGYRSLIDDMIEYESSGYKNVNRAELEGVETEVSFVTGFVKHHVSADFSNPKNLNNNKQLARRAKQNYKWQAETGWEQWDAAMSVQYAAKRFDDDDNTIRLGGYTLWDASVGYHFTEQFRVSGRVDNLFNKDYQTASGYETPSRSYYLNFSYEM